MAFQFNVAGFISGMVDQSNKIIAQNQRDSALDIQKAAQGETVRHNKATEQNNYYKLLTGGSMSPKDQALTQSRLARAKIMGQQASGTYDPSGKLKNKATDGLLPEPAGARDSTNQWGSGPGPAVGGTPGMGGVTRPFPSDAQNEASDDDTVAAQDALDDEDDDE